MAIYTTNNKIWKLDNKWVNKPDPVPPFNTVTIGSQIWSKPNLAVDDGGEGIARFEHVIVNSVDLGPQYYYTYDAALRVANTIPGWHLPSYEEWNTLINTVGGHNNNPALKLKSSDSSWGNKAGTDDYGFTMLPCRFATYDSELGEVVLADYRMDPIAEFYTSSALSSGRTYFVTQYNGVDIYNTSDMNYDYYMTIRLIKDT